jgi:uncharacterized membrane protein
MSPKRKHGELRPSKDGSLTVDAAVDTVADTTAGAGRDRRYARYVVIAAAVFVVLLSILVVQRYRDFYGGRFDLGNMVQAVHNTAHGRVLEVTDAEGRQVSRLGAHVDPILVAFALPWRVWPSPVMLLVAQIVIVSLSAWPAWRLGRRILGDARAAFFMTVALLLYPPLEYAVLNEFHPVTLAVPFLLFAFVELEEDHRWRAVPWLVLAALCKEEIPLLLALMGVYFAWRKRAWWPLAVTVAAGAYFLVAVFVVMPHFASGPSPIMERYSDYGDSAGGLVRGIVTHPLAAAADFLSWSNIAYLLRLLWPFGFLSLLSPLTLLIAVPEIILNALADNEFQRSIEYHYVAGEVPFVFAAAVLGLARLRGLLAGRKKVDGGGGREVARAERRRRARRPTDARPWGGRLPVSTLAGAVLALSLAGNYFMGPLPFSLPGAEKSGHDYRVTGHAVALAEAVDQIPTGDDVVVATDNDAGSHLSARRVVYVFPVTKDAEYVLIDRKRGFVYDHEDPVGHENAFGEFIKAEYLSGRYELVIEPLDDQSVWLFKRKDDVAAPGGTIPIPSPLPTASTPPR